ncbi:histidine kinase [Pedobacter sp. PLR]|uniref:sensor histidine kinase n=1 Tax=Pedobacter sp. PLR TaxID=2994465 RepID=UPI002245B768|nr:histidine kinase [Pedobacter sp. PLR]MCX2453682.1 histidine kinase [Pedobacter sp. PLR]
MTPALKQHFSQTFANYRWLIHLLFWTLFVTFIYLITSSNGLFNNPKFPKPFPILSISTFCLVIFLQSYTFLFVVIPLHKNKKIIFWLSFPAMLLCCFLINAAITKLVISTIPIMSSRPEFNWDRMFGNRLLLYLFISSIFIAFYYFIDIYDRQKEIQRLEGFKSEKIELESRFLKSQVNPHFLFNTLNNIYALSLKKSERTPVIIEKLESLLHYMLYECKEDLVELDDEFTFTNSYIALEKLRHNEEQCTITTTIKGMTSGHKIAPLLLINFLENAFKHGTKTSFGKSWINMDIEVLKKELHFKLKNSKPEGATHQVFSEYQGGIGLKNVKRRLEILYPKRHKLTIHNAPDHFEIYLILNF